MTKPIKNISSGLLFSFKNHSILALLFIFSFTILPFSGIAQSAPITIDGLFDDWTADLTTLSDTPESISGIDLLEMTVTNDEDFLYIKLTTDTEFDLTDYLIKQQINLYLDTDNDANTGFEIQNGYGSELGIVFRDLYSHYNVEPYSQVSFADISLRVAPTVTSNRFEIAIRRDAIPDESNPLFTSPTIKILFINSDNNDRLPNNGEVFTYTFDETPVPSFMPTNLSKDDPSHIRFLAYNTLWNGLTDADRIPHFDNIISALAPDIIGFSECSETDLEDVKDFLDGCIPTNDPQGWYVEKNSGDLITASRWPISQSWDGVERHFSVLIDLPDYYASDILFTNAHLSCCAKDAERQEQVDAYIEFILDAKSPGGIIDLPKETPFVYGGDLNLVGYAQQLTTLVTGDIQNTSDYGPGGPPDWDNTDLTEQACLQSDKRMAYTWRDDDGSYPPGKLDFLIYADAVMDAEKSFVIQTEVMPEARLELYGLDMDDTANASDHFPIVTDFSITTLVGIHEHPQQSYAVYPNPATNNLNVKFRQSGNYQVMLFDVSGHKIQSQQSTYDVDQITMEIGNLSSGLYFIKTISADGETAVQKLIKL